MLANLRKHGEHSGSWVSLLKLIALKKRFRIICRGKIVFYLDIKVSKFTQRLQGLQGCHLNQKKLKVEL